MDKDNCAIDLFVFHSEISRTIKFAKSGVDGVIIDWEQSGKDSRQFLYNTQINLHTLDDLRKVKAEILLPVICRVNKFALLGENEIEEAVLNGTNEILLPMVESPGEVESVLKLVNQRCGVGILLETDQAIKNAREFSKLPLSRVYIGLNDLSIERKLKNLFSPLIDGTIDEIRPYFGMPFGICGLTSPQRGFPIPCNLLLNEMKRLRCDFSFLRRTFLRDSLSADPKDIIDKIRNYYRLPVKNDSSELKNMIAQIITVT